MRSAGVSRAKVAWDDGTSPSSVEYDKVAPLPSGASKLASVEDLVLVKPESGYSWAFAQVVRVEGDSVFAQLASGAERQLSQKEYVILE